MARMLSQMKLRALEEEVMMMLHAHRDCLRNRHNPDPDKDPKKITFDVGDGYYGEAFGIMRALERLGYGRMGASNSSIVESDNKLNLKAWFSGLEQHVLHQENYYSKKHTCEFCLFKYGKDDVHELNKMSIEELVTSDSLHLREYGTLLSRHQLRDQFTNEESAGDERYNFRMKVQLRIIEEYRKRGIYGYFNKNKLKR